LNGSESRPSGTRTLKTQNGVLYCSKCGAYLGDRINGVLYKFGRVISTDHRCTILTIGQVKKGKNEK